MNDWTPKAIATLGVTSVVTLWAFYWLTTVAAPASAVAAVSTQLEAHTDRMEQMASDRNEQTAAQLRLLRLICISMAKNSTVASECAR